MNAVIWFMYRIVKGVLWLYCHARFRFEVEGEHNLPKRGGYILASNHVSGYDTILIPVYLKSQMAIAAKSELYANPWLKPWLVLTGMIPTVRENATYTESKRFKNRAESTMNRGLVFGIFPEGTRSRSGKLLPFEPGAGSIATQTRRHVVPVGISYPNDTRRRSSMSRVFRRRVVRIVFGRSINSLGYRHKDLTVVMRREIAELSGQELQDVCAVAPEAM